MNFYTNGKTFHLFTKIKINRILFQLLTKEKVINLITLLSKPKKSLLNKDYQFLIKEI
jgi:hypothetical protein